MGALEDIDRTLDGLCACGCGERLDPGGASGWFASLVCQARFQGGEGAAQEALAEWTRERLAMLGVSVEFDARPLVEAVAAGWRGVPREGLRWPESDADLALTTSVIEPFQPSAEARAHLTAEQITAVAFRRPCATCGRPTVPRLVNVMMERPRFDVWDFADPGPEGLGLPEVRQAHGCSDCLRPFPAPLTWAVLDFDAGAQLYRFGLSAAPGGGPGVAITMSAEMVGYGVDPALAWDELERRLAEQALPTCVVPGCADKARARFAVDHPLVVCGRSWARGDVVELCPRHAHFLYRGEDPAQPGLPIVWRDLAAAERFVRTPLRTGQPRSSFPYSP